MDKIEVGEWIRLKYGKIEKVKNNDYYMQQYIECEKGLYPKENIVKHSKNKIDIVEVGDIVKLVDVLSKEVIYIYDNEMLEAVKQDIKEGQFLKSILTHEQFESMKYNFEEEE